MISLHHLTKRYPTQNGYKYVANNLCHVFPTGATVGLLGRNGTGKSTLLSLIAGLTRPTHGKIISSGSISWPVGFKGSFHQDLTGRQNTKFVARSHGVDTDQLVEFVEDFAELGHHFDMPLRSYSSGMRARLAFGVSMGIPFDTYLVDEVTAVGDASFRLKSGAVFKERRKTSGAIIVSHNMKMLRETCDFGVVLEDGKLFAHDTIKAAIQHHKANMGTQEIAGTSA